MIFAGKEIVVKLPLLLLLIAISVGAQDQGNAGAALIRDPSCSVSLGLLIRAGGTYYTGLAGQLAIRHMQTSNTDFVSLPEGSVLCSNVTFDLKDTLGLPAEGVKAALGWGPSVDAIVGASRSAVSGPLSLAAQVFDVPVISYASTAASLSDKDSYPLFHRTVPPDAVAANVMASMCAYFNFTRIGILFINDPWGSNYANDLASFGIQHGVEVVASRKYTSGDVATIRGAVTALSDSGVRIMVCFMFGQDFEDILDVTRELGMTNTKGYSWISADALKTPENFAASTANPAEIRDQLAGWISVWLNPLHGTVQERFEAEAARFRALNSSSVLGWWHADMSATWSGFDGYSALMYDAVWLSALSASNTKSSMAPTRPGTRTVSSELKAVQFAGVTGTVALQENGDRSGDGLTYSILNWQPNPSTGKIDVVEFGTWEGSRGFQWIVDPLWPGHKAPGWENIPRGIALCPAGTFFNFSVNVCENCHEGTHGGENGCLPCEIGTFAPNKGMVKCVPCSMGFADTEGLSVCLACPENSAVPTGSPALSAAHCSCDRGTYLVNSTNRFNATGGINLDWVPVCKRCPPGATCDGGAILPYPRQGSWGNKDCREYGGDQECTEWDRFVQCTPEEACVGGPNFTCGLGRRGRMCMEVERDHFNVGAVFFFPCNGSQGVIGTAFAIVATIVAWLLMNTVASSSYDALDIALLFLQITGMIAAFPLRWHPILGILNTALNLVNFEVDFVSPCPKALSAEVLFYIQLALPIMFAIGYGLYFLLRNIRAGSNGGRSLLYSVWHDSRPHFLSAVITSYHQISMKSFGALKCTEFQDGRFYLKMAPEIECWVGHHVPMACVAVLYIIVVVIGMPVGIFLYTRSKRKNNLLTADSSLSFLWERYELEWIWWHSTLIARRAVIAFILMVVDMPMIQGASASAVIAFFIVLHSFAQPFVDDSLDMLENVTLFGILLYSLAGLLFFPHLTDSTKGFTCPDDGREVCGSEDDSKYRTAVMVIITILLLILFCVQVTISNVLEKAREDKALANIRSFMKTVDQGFARLGSVVAGSHDDGMMLQQAAASARKLVEEESQGPTKNGVSKRGGGKSPITGGKGDAGWGVAVKDLLAGEDKSALGLSVEPAFEGANQAALESVLEAYSMDLWAKWVASTKKDGNSRDADVKMKAACIFSRIRARFNSVEGVSGHSVSTLAEVVRGASEIDGIFDWLIAESTAEDRMHLVSIIRRLAEWNEKQISQGLDHRYIQLIKPFWRPTLIWFSIRASRQRQGMMRNLFDSIIESSQVPSKRGDAEDGSLPLDHAHRIPSHFEASDRIFSKISYARNWLEAKLMPPSYVQPTVFMPDAPEQAHKPAPAVDSLPVRRKSVPESIIDSKVRNVGGQVNETGRLQKSSNPDQEALKLNSRDGQVKETKDGCEGSDQVEGANNGHNASDQVREDNAAGLTSSVVGPVSSGAPRPVDVEEELLDSYWI